MPDWDTLSEDQKKVNTRHQEIFAAYAEITDYEVGCLVQAIEDLGVLDNILIIYCTGDNGSSCNGGVDGRFNTFASFNQVPETMVCVMHIIFTRTGTTVTAAQKMVSPA